MKATEQYFPVVLFIMLYKVILTFKSVDEILKCVHSNESYWAVPSNEALFFLFSNERSSEARSCGAIHISVLNISSLVVESV